MRHTFLFLWLFFFCSASSATAQEYDLVQALTEQSRTINTLQTTFTQEKKLAFLQNPLRSEGYFFFSRHFKGTQSPALLWEYTSPAPSGIWYAQGKSWLWMHTRAKLRAADRQENIMLSAMVEQILFWLTIQPQSIQAHFTIEQEQQPLCMKLRPKRQQFFSALQVCLRADLHSLASLHLEEKQGDSTRIVFAQPEINKQELTAFPDGSPFPQ